MQKCEKVIFYTWVNEKGWSALDGFVHHAARVDHETHLLAAYVPDRASLHHVRNFIAIKKISISASQ